MTSFLRYTILEYRSRQLLAMRNTNPFDDVNISNDSGVNNRVAGDKDYFSSSLFPDWLSRSWMATSPSPNDVPHGEDDDESLYHDCISKDEMEDETTSLLAKATAQRNGTDSHPYTPVGERIKFYNATTSASATTTPVINNQRRKRNDYASNIFDGRDIKIDTSLQREQPNDLSIVSPLAEALTTWLSPYAKSAKRAGRKIWLSESSIDEETEAYEDENAQSNAVRFHPNFKDPGGEEKESGLFEPSELIACVDDNADR